MPAETIAIGTELTSGAKLDTNSQWLSLELAAAGIAVHYHTTLADDLQANINAFRVAVDRADLIVITGGLGPTLDDLTREALARMLGVGLVLHEPSLEIIRGMFARRGREMPERNVIQAMFPQGSTPIPNPRGTAPGIWLEIPRGTRPPCLVAALPGVPSEMKPMFREQILPRLGSLATGRVIRHARLQCFGLGESAAEELLGDITARGRDPEVGITVHEATITLRIVAEAPSPDTAQDKILATRQQILERLGEHVYGEEEEELEDIVVRELRARRKTLASCEGASGGLVARRLQRIDPNGEIYRGGLSGLSGDALSSILAISPSQLRETGPHGPERASQLALATRDRLQVDYALAITPRLRSADQEGTVEVPVAHYALATPQTVEVRELNLVGDPAIAQARLTKSALNLLRLHLRNC
ncbi:MAG: CinA family nicotinamide mononucleotide deamidase-related protein [Planctomycetaceae bacterium]